ncbi:MAG TPA: type II toxin-antitoxin system VapC family toxin [Candidatus Limnocylindrales bacterium]
MTFTVGPEVIVVDASVAVEVLLGHEAWLDRWSRWVDADAMVLVPPHFPIEVANALLRGLRLEPIDAAERLDRLYRTGIETADRGLPGLVSTVRLAALHHLTTYDAAYIELAVDVDGQLATLDRDLAAAAEAEGVNVIGG